MAKYEESSSGAFDSEAENKKKAPVELSIAKRRTEKFMTCNGLVRLRIKK